MHSGTVSPVSRATELKNTIGLADRCARPTSFADESAGAQLPAYDADGFLDLPNSRRLYEANGTVFQVARAMLTRSLER